MRLLIKRVTVGTGEDERTRIEITYRFGPPAPQEQNTISHGVTNSSLSGATS